MKTKSFYFLEGESSNYKVLQAQRFAEDLGKKRFIAIHDEISQDADLNNPKIDEWAYWGVNNDLPQKLVSAIVDNAVSMGLLEFIAEMIAGNGYWLYKVVGYDAEGNELREAVDIPEISDWLEENNIEHYFRESAEDYVYFANIFSEMIMTRKGDKVASIRSLDASMCRTANRLNSFGKINTYFFYHDWQNVIKSKVQRMLSYQYGKTIPSKFTIHSRNYFPTSVFYGVAQYLGAMRWLRVSSKVPDWHDANMDNAWNIKYHVEIIDTYFEHNYPDLSADELAAEENKFIDHLKKFLSGVENAGKTFVSKFTWDSVKGEMIYTVKITPLNNATNHDAYLPLFQQSNSALCSAFGVDPSIANIDTGNSLTNADKRTSFNIFNLTRTSTPRAKMLEPLKTVWDINKWDKKIKIGFRNRFLTPLDENKTGVQNANQKQPVVNQ